MYHDDASQYGYRRTRSLDSYDTLERLENHRQQRRQYLDNRSKFERRPPSVPPPQVPNQRPTTPVSQLIQDFTPKLMDVADSASYMEPNAQKPPTDNHDNRNGHILSLECPRKISYTSTCHIDITPTQASSNVEHIFHSRISHHDGGNEPKAVDTLDGSNEITTPIQIFDPKETNWTSSNIVPCQEVNNYIFNSPLIDRNQTSANNFNTTNTSWISQNEVPKNSATTKEEEWCLKSPAETTYKRNAFPSEKTYYNKPQTHERLFVNKPEVTRPRHPVAEKREVFHKQDIFPQQNVVKQDVNINNFSKATPFLTEQIKHDDSYHSLMQPLKLSLQSPVPTPRNIMQPNSMESGIQSPKSYPAYLKTQPIREWKPVNMSPIKKTNTFPNYNSLPRSMPCNEHKEHRKYSEATFDTTDCPMFIMPVVEAHKTNPIMSSRTQCSTGKQPNKLNITFPMPRRSSTGTVGDTRLRRSQMPSIPVKLLVQKFSNK